MAGTMGENEAWNMIKWGFCRSRYESVIAPLWAIHRSFNPHVSTTLHSEYRGNWPASHRGRLDGPLLADLLVDFHESFGESLELAELGNLALGLANGGGAGEHLRLRLPPELISQSDVGAVTGVLSLCAVAVGFSTTAVNGNNASWPQVAKLAKLRQQGAPLALPGSTRYGASELSGYKFRMVSGLHAVSRADRAVALPVPQFMRSP